MIKQFIFAKNIYPMFEGKHKELLEIKPKIALLTKIIDDILIIITESIIIANLIGACTQFRV